MKARVLTLILSALSLGATPVLAHHSFAMYQRDKTLTLSGTVKEYDWTSPHVMIQVLADGAKSGPVMWQIEGSSPTVLARGGWTSTLLRPGDRISLGIHPRKDGGAGGLLADEQQMLVNGQPARGVLWLQTPAEEGCQR
jgi:Family of unknown function (DUF6152)